MRKLLYCKWTWPPPDRSLFLPTALHPWCLHGIFRGLPGWPSESYPSAVSEKGGAKGHLLSPPQSLDPQGQNPSIGLQCFI